MIKHIVMWKLKDYAEGNDKQFNANEIKIRLEALKDKISEIGKIEVGINNNSANSYDVVLYSEFESYESLNSYQNHPSHLEVAAFVKAVNVDRACVDYEA
ncbi:Dabb family protein [Clostridium sp. YIM B02505]|uniref:Dabb family protein n=1 Tax=Clostridium yunnanense TaxID=2800325 RepID=A0ABS1EMG7_9CLOT|nr:Dabb family protein [Clostridium yunnanense]MBK1810592.1 Dabb family protein [Clostridium yunnanense]